MLTVSARSGEAARRIKHQPAAPDVIQRAAARTASGQAPPSAANPLPPRAGGATDNSSRRTGRAIDNSARRGLWGKEEAAAESAGVC